MRFPGCEDLRAFEADRDRVVDGHSFLRRRPSRVPGGTIVGEVDDVGGHWALRRGIPLARPSGLPGCGLSAALSGPSRAGALPGLAGGPTHPLSRYSLGFAVVRLSLDCITREARGDVSPGKHPDVSFGKRPCPLGLPLTWADSLRKLSFQRVAMSGRPVSGTR